LTHARTAHVLGAGWQLARFKAAVVARTRTPTEALLLGASFGAVTYAVYDLTNHATLRDWRATTVVDIGWGAFSCGAAAWIAATVARPA